MIGDIDETTLMNLHPYNKQPAGENVVLRATQMSKLRDRLRLSKDQVIRYFLIPNVI